MKNLRFESCLNRDGTNKQMRHVRLGTAYRRGICLKARIHGIFVAEQDRYDLALLLYSDFFRLYKKKYTNFNTFMKNEKEQTKSWFSRAGYAKTGKGKATREMF